MHVCVCVCDIYIYIYIWSSIEYARAHGEAVPLRI